MRRRAQPVRTKIVATVGPASAEESVLRQLIAAGVDVFRLNFAHGDWAWHSAVVARIRALAAERGIDLTLHSPRAPVTLTCDRARLLLALSNLLDNGLKYCVAGDRVEIGGEEGDGRMRLWVADTGPGIGEAEQPRIFERFYRGRTRTDDGQEIPGSGLGLSIVASIVLAHGWTIRVESAPGQGARFVIDTVISEQ